MNFLNSPEEEIAVKMIAKDIQNTEEKSLPFSAAVISGNLLFVSGQVPLRDGMLAGETFFEQANVVFDNIEEVLVLADVGLSSVLKVTAWLTSAKLFSDFNAVYALRMGGHRPARTTIVSALALPGAMIEVEVIAELG